MGPILVLLLLEHSSSSFDVPNLCFSQGHSAAARHRAGERPDPAEEHSKSVEGGQGAERVSEVYQHTFQALPEKVSWVLLLVPVNVSLINEVCFTFQPCPRENVDRASDEQQYEGEISAEIIETEAEFEDDYQRKLAEYKKQLEQWKLWRSKQVPATPGH